MPPREAGAKAKAAAAQAVKLQDRLGEAHASMALAYFWCDWNWAEAGSAFREAIDLKPNFAAAHNWYAAFLNVMLRFDEAAKEQKVAEDLDPLSLTIAMNAADPYYFSRQYSSAIEHFKRVLRRDAGFPAAHYNLGRAYVQAGKCGEAVSAFQSAARLSGAPQANAALAQAYARLGEVKKAEAILDEMQELGIDSTHWLGSLLDLANSIRPWKNSSRHSKKDLFGWFISKPTRCTMISDRILLSLRFSSA